MTKEKIIQKYNKDVSNAFLAIFVGTKYSDWRETFHIKSEQIARTIWSEAYKLNYPQT